MVRGYPGRPTIFAGQELTLHAAADTCSEPFRAMFFRWCASWEHIGVSGTWRAECGHPGSSMEPWNWPAYRFRVPREWPSGAYLAVLGDEGQADPCARNTTLFVVKTKPGSRRARILYKLPLFTYTAYNAEGGGSLYSGPANQVTLQRPGCGAGGETFDSSCPDAYDTSSPRQTFAHWDAPFVRWLESNGYGVDYCTDLDIHEAENEWLDCYRLLLSVGHDEYWSEPMRRNVERFIRGGGNVAFFSGNTCWWRVHVDGHGTNLSCNKRKLPGEAEAFDQWMRIDPETRLTGVSFRYGGGWWTGRRTPLGYTVRDAGHWIYEGTGLRNGDVFGGGADQALIGYECDGVPPTGHGTLSDFHILGFAGLTPEWEYRQTDPAAATLGVHENRGTVFTAATTDWARVLNQGDPVIDQITRNVVNRLIIQGARRLA